MIRVINKWTCIVGLVILASGCSKDFLDEQPSEFVNIDQLKEAAENNPDITVGFMDGIYALMVQTGSGGSDLNHDDFGHKGNDIYSDMLSGDVALSVSTYGWYRADITEFNAPTDFTSFRNRQVWQFYFSLIRSANTVIMTATNGEPEVDPDVEGNRYTLGQALAIRAFSYFYLSQYFANEYDPANDILPIMAAPDFDAKPKSSMADVYQFMEDDLTRAIDLLNGYSRPGKKQINKEVAQGLLAYVLASRGDRWADVATLAGEVITTSGASLMSAKEVVYAVDPETGIESGSGFNDITISSWLWGFDITLDEELGLVSWWGQMDAFSYSYAWAGDYKAIDAGLYDQIPEDDVRKGQFYIYDEDDEEDDVQAPARNLQPLNKFYDPAREIGGTSTSTEQDYVYMRLEEMYLLQAEAYANMGQEALARGPLKDLLEERLPDVSYVDGLSGQALLDEIYLQTRIELWGEGKSYLALKRNKATATRGSNHLSFVGVPIPHNDERLTFEIPEREIQDNPHINDQN